MPTHSNSAPTPRSDSCEGEMATRAKVAKRFGRAVATQIIPAAIFWPAEDYHQDFYRKNPGHYKKYRKGCGRDRRLKQLWGKEAGGP